MTLDVDRIALLEWNREGDMVVALFGAAMGLMAMLLLINRLNRPVDPTDAIRAGLKTGQFLPHYQPIFNTADKAIVGCEALARWHRSDGNIAGPGAFIELMEREGLLPQLTRQLITRSLRELAPIMRHSRQFRVAFNISPDELLADTFATDMCRIAAQFDVPRQQITFEITEREQLAAINEAISAVSALRYLGFHVALDDTGTGHNGLANVQRLGADIIKIDKHFVDQIEMSDTAAAIVELLVKVSGQLGAETVAEGVETDGQLAALRNIGVDKGQGFLIAPALDRQDFFKLYHQDAQKILRLQRQAA